MLHIYLFLHSPQKNEQNKALGDTLFQNLISMQIMLRKITKNKFPSRAKIF